MACGDGLPFLWGGSDNAGMALDAKAIEAGILPDPKNSGLAGRYETRSDLGVDMFCAVERSGNNFAIGFLSTSGPESKCEGIGTAKVNGENVEISLNGQGPCKFTARYDGFELRFPAMLDSGCAQYCTNGVSFSGTPYFMIKAGSAAARATLGRDIERLCR